MTQTFILRRREHDIVRCFARENIREFNDIVPMPFQSISDRGGDVVVEEKLQFAGGSAICASASCSISARWSS